MQRMICSNHSNYTICQDIRLVVATLDKHSKFQYAIQCPAHPHDSHVALWYPALYQCSIDGCITGPLSEDHEVWKPTNSEFIFAFNVMLGNSM